MHSAKSAKDILLNNLSIATREERANIHYLGCPSKGADFPYMYVACGEPRGVWRKSAPLYLIQMYNKTK